MIQRRQREVAARNRFSFTNPADEAAFKSWAEGMEGKYKPGAGAWSRKANQNVGSTEDESAVPSPKLWEQQEEMSVMAGYRQEMMELVKDAPESAYELSLRDMVVEMPGKVVIEEVKVRKDARRVERRMSRKESMDAGFLIRMSLPFSLGWKKKKDESSGAGGSKVSPRPIREKTDADGGRSNSNGSSDSSSSARSRKLSGCLPLFLSVKNRFRRI